MTARSSSKSSKASRERAKGDEPGAPTIAGQQWPPETDRQRERREDRQERALKAHDAAEKARAEREDRERKDFAERPESAR